MRVVKLGGSLFSGRFLRPWLAALAQGVGRVVVVPGGGPFADQVRVAQRRWPFDHDTAHRMAMLGMAQYGLMLTGLQSGLVPAVDEVEIKSALGQSAVPVWVPGHWQPLDMARRWSVTSDSLAAWLAGRLGASQLLLVKSLKLTAAVVGAGGLARHGVIDEALPELLARAPYTCRIVAAQDHAAFAAAIDDDRGVGTLVTASTADGT